MFNEWNEMKMIYDEDDELTEIVSGQDPQIQAIIAGYDFDPDAPTERVSVDDPRLSQFLNNLDQPFDINESELARTENISVDDPRVQATLFQFSEAEAETVLRPLVRTPETKFRTVLLCVSEVDTEPTESLGSRPLHAAEFVPVATNVEVEPTRDLQAKPLSVEVRRERRGSIRTIALLASLAFCFLSVATLVMVLISSS